MHAGTDIKQDPYSEERDVAFVSPGRSHVIIRNVPMHTSNYIELFLEQDSCLDGNANSPSVNQIYPFATFDIKREPGMWDTLAATPTGDSDVDIAIGGPHQTLLEYVTVKQEPADRSPTHHLSNSLDSYSRSCNNDIETNNTAEKLNTYTTVTDGTCVQNQVYPVLLSHIAYTSFGTPCSMINIQPCKVVLTDIAKAFPSLTLNNFVKIVDTEPKIEIDVCKYELNNDADMGRAERVLDEEHHNTTWIQIETHLPDPSSSSIDNTKIVSNRLLQSRTNPVDTQTDSVKKQVSCTRCTRTFATLYNLKRHMAIHRDVKRYQCEQCKYSCKRSYELKKHAKLHSTNTNEKVFKCSMCPYIGQTSSDFKKHIAMHSGVKPFWCMITHHPLKCTYCTYTCTQLSHLKQHIATHTKEQRLKFLLIRRNDSKPIKCPLCTFQCKWQSGMKRHLPIHNETFKCHQCTYCCNTSSKLQQHIKIHNRTPFKCHQCTYTCKNPSALQRHESIHNNIFKCAKCKYSCDTSNKLKQHIQIHNKSYKCTKCTYTCTQSSMLKRHESIHNTFKCAKCKYSCNTSSKLQQHIKIHNRTQSFKCTQCTYYCNTSIKLEQHIKIHKRIFFKCTKCTYMCTTLIALQRHLSIHNNTFKCAKCKYSCDTSTKLKQHIEIHNKSFKCTKCTYTCTQSGALQRHLEIHTEKPFSCIQCTFLCTKSEYLEEHVRIHSGEQTFNCPVCVYTSTQQDVWRHIQEHTVDSSQNHQ